MSADTPSPTRTLAGNLLYYQPGRLRGKWLTRFYLLHDQFIFAINQQPPNIEVAIKQPSQVTWLQQARIVYPNASGGSNSTEYAGQKFVFGVSTTAAATPLNNAADSTASSSSWSNYLQSTVSNQLNNAAASGGSPDCWLAAKSYNDMLDWVNAIESAIQLPHLLLASQSQTTETAQGSDKRTDDNGTEWPSYQPSKQQPVEPGASQTFESSTESTGVDSTSQKDVLDDLLQLKLSANELGEAELSLRLSDSMRSEVAVPTAVTADVGPTDDTQAADQPISQLTQQLEAQLAEIEATQQQLIEKIVQLKQQKKVLSKELKSLQQQITTLQTDQQQAAREVTVVKQTNDRYMIDRKRLLHAMSSLHAKLKQCDPEQLSYQLNLPLHPQNNNLVEVVERSNRMVADVMTDLQRIQSNCAPAPKPNPTGNGTTPSLAALNSGSSTPTVSPLLQPYSPAATAMLPGTQHTNSPTHIALTSMLAIELHSAYHTALTHTGQLRLSCNAVQSSIHKLTQEKIAEYKARLQAERQRQAQASQAFKYGVYGGRV